MIPVLQAEKLELSTLTEKFGLTITHNAQFFTEWQEDLPELSALEKQLLDRVKYAKIQNPKSKIQNPKLSYVFSSYLYR